MEWEVLAEHALIKMPGETTLKENFFDE